MYLSTLIVLDIRNDYSFEKFTYTEPLKNCRCHDSRPLKYTKNGRNTHIC